MLRRLLPLTALALAGCATTERAATERSPQIEAVAVPAVPVPLMKEVIARLASDEFEGRGPGTRAEDLTITEIIARFNAAGLQPGNKGQWLQEVPTVDITAKGASPLTVSGGTKPLSFAYGSDFVAGSYRVTPQTSLANSDMVFVGYGIVAPELGWNDYAGVDMRGKTAIILVNDPDYAMATEEGPFKGRRMTYYGRWTYKFEEAARQGAAAALIVHDTFPAAYGWNVVNSSWTGTQHYVQRADNAMSETQVNGWIQNPMAEAIVASSGKDFATLSAAAGRKGFKPVPLGLKASLSFANTIKTGVSRNVIGILPGTSRPEEYVLNTAHWDHLGHCAVDASGDDICNGAVDNATGIAALVALSDMNRRAGPTPRSQVYIAWTLEESGLLGSEWYARHPAYPLERTVGGVNVDALEAGGAARDWAMRGGDKSGLTGYFRRALTAMGLREAPEPTPERGKYYRSDHFSLAKQGVPMFYGARGLDLIDGGPEAGRAANEAYNSKIYHSPKDEYADAWNMTGISQDVGLFYRIGRALAEGSDWPNWHPTDEFRAVRDESCAASSAGC